MRIWAPSSIHLYNSLKQKNVFGPLTRLISNFIELSYLIPFIWILSREFKLIFISFRLKSNGRNHVAWVTERYLCLSRKKVQQSSIHSNIHFDVDTTKKTKRIKKSDVQSLLSRHPIRSNYTQYIKVKLCIAQPNNNKN